MIFKNKKEIVSVNKGIELPNGKIRSVPIQAIYKGVVTVYQAIRSCFGSGLWVSHKPWINTEVWKNK